MLIVHQTRAFGILFILIFYLYELVFFVNFVKDSFVIGDLLFTKFFVVVFFAQILSKTLSIIIN